MCRSMTSAVECSAYVVAWRSVANETESGYFGGVWRVRWCAASVAECG